MSARDRIRWLENRFYAAIRHPAAADAGHADAGQSGLRAFDGRRYCLVVTYRRNGDPVSTPVWFALDGDRVVFEADSDSLKVKRLRRNARVRIAPCTVRGRPLAPPIEATARLLDQSAEGPAKQALDDKYGLPRRAMVRVRPMPAAGPTYVEVKPA